MDREWQYCAYCGEEVDTGWECNGCGYDWLPYAYPWWKRLRDRLLKATNRGLDKRS